MLIFPTFGGPECKQAPQLDADRRGNIWIE